MDQSGQSQAVVQWNIQGPMYAVPWILTGLSMWAVGVRIYLRKKFSMRIESDDWIMAAAVVLQIAYQSIVTVSMTKGVGKALEPMEVHEFVNMLMWSWFTSPLAVLVHVVARVSIAVLLVRVFGVRSWFRWFMIIFTGAMVIMGFLNFIIVWLQARPVEALWDITMDADRWDPDILQTVSTVLHVFFAASDLFYSVFPVVFVWKLNMPVRRKIGLCIVMALSIITFGIALAKLVLIIGSVGMGGDVAAEATDVFYTFGVLTLITGVEANLVIIIGCVPKLRALNKLNIIGSIGFGFSSLLRSTLGRSKHTSKPGLSASTSEGNPHPFQDLSGYSNLEMQPRLLRPDGGAGMETSVVCNYSSSHISQDYEGKNIRRTNDFTITMDSV